MVRLFFASWVVVVLALASGCTPTLCEHSQQVDLTKLAGNCTGVTTGTLLGEASTCTTRVKGCTADEQKLLSTALDCLGRQSTCTSGTRGVYEAAQQACFAPLSTLSEACVSSLFGGVKPGQDGGVDAGYVDAGPQPIDDGGQGLVLVGVADETTLAFAWSQVQRGDVATYALIGTADGGREAERAISSARINTTLGAASTAAQRFLLVGYTAQGVVAYGTDDAGVEDAGTGQCARPSDCPNEKVCDLGQCKTQTCRAGGTNTCPNQYQCSLNGVCVHTDFDGGTFDAGSVTPGVQLRPLPFVSNEVSLAAGVPTFKGDVPLGSFAARRPVVLGIDSARVMVAVEQEGQLFTHASTQHGVDLPDDARTTGAIDTVGTRARTTYNADSRLTYACYTVGRGVRVQISTDFGRTWGRLATTVETFDDGGTSLITDCALASWRDGGALLVTVEDGTIQTRVISSGLSVGDPSPAFISSTQYFAPSHPAVATLPGESMVHITFTASRTTTAGAQDTEPLGVYRDGTLGAFTQPSGLTVPTGSQQDFTSVVIDPKTKRALAAFTSVDATTGGSPISTVYVSMWNATLRQWVSGSDLQVFASQQNTSLLFPTKAPTDLWFAFSPSVVALPSGKLGLTFVAGPRAGANGDYRQYFIPFDFDQSSPLATGKGWFVRPVVKVSDLRVLDPRGASSVPQPPVSSASADSQISVYGAFIEGLGANGDGEGRAIFFSRP